jgi:hypothetical protein
MTFLLAGFQIQAFCNSLKQIHKMDQKSLTRSMIKMSSFDFERANRFVFAALIVRLELLYVTRASFNGRDGA